MKSFFFFFNKFDNKSFVKLNKFKINEDKKNNETQGFDFTKRFLLSVKNVDNCE